jgi:hypothetical protein
MSFALPKLLEILASFTIALAVLLAGLAVERRKTLPRLNSQAALFNILYFAPASILQKILAPAGAAVSGFVIGRAGGGLIALPGDGWRIVPAALVYIAVVDWANICSIAPNTASPFFGRCTRCTIVIWNST